VVPRPVGKLTELRGRQVRAESARGVAEASLPEDRQVEQAFDEDHGGELVSQFPGEQAALGATEEAMGKGLAGAAAVEVDDATILAAREDNTLAECTAALRVDEAGALQQL